MAIQYIGNTISGVSSDTKPTLTANELGVLFVETNTDKVYQWDGDSWNEITSTAANLSGTTLNSNIVTSSLTTVGALNAGSITSGFTSIDVGSGAITTTGTITAGNLNVTGTTTTVNSTNTTISDKIIELASGASTGADAGIIIERGSTGHNAIMAWDEGNDRFHFGTTTDTGTASSLTITTGTLAANLVGNVTGNITGNVTGTADVATTVTLHGSGNVTYYPTFVDATSGNENIRVDSDWTYNASTNKMTVGNIGIPDDGVLEFGGSQDLQIGHASAGGGSSFIKDLGSGVLYIDSNGSGIYMRKSDGTAMATLLTDGAVTLHHNGSARVATSAAGATVTGAFTATGPTTASSTNVGYFSGTINNNTYLLVENLHTSASGSHAVVLAKQAQANGGDPKLMVQAPGITWALGADNDDDDVFKISGHANLETNTRLTIDGNGNIGIGNTAPDQKLTVGGHILQTSATDADSANKYAIHLMEHYDTDDEEWPMISGWSQAASHTLALGGFDDAFNAATEIKFYTAANVTTRTGSERMTIKADGKVGIGTTAPNTSLHVVGNTTIAGHTYFGSQGSNYDVVFYGSTSGQNAVWDASDKSLEFADAASATFGTGGDMKIWHNSNVNRIDLTSPLYIYDASNYVLIGEHASNDTLEMKLVGAADHDAALYFGDANDAVEAGFWWDTSEAKLHFQGHNNATRMTIDNAGNVGIGTTSPSYKLHVNGATYLAGDAYLNHTGNKIEAGASYNMITSYGYMRLQSNSSVYVALDNDGSGTDAVFAVRANGAGTNVFSVSEAGQVKITGGSPGADKVLTSDANGLATWEAASGGGGTVTMTVKNGVTVTQGKGVAVNTDGEAVPYDWGSHLKPTEQYGELNPIIKGIDAADSGWQNPSFSSSHNIFYDYNINKYVAFFQFFSGRGNRAATGSGAQWADTGTYPTNATGEKPINDLLGSGNEIDQEYTWITCFGTMNNSTGAITWSGYQKMPIQVQPDTAYQDWARDAGARVSMGSNNIIYDAQPAAAGNYAAGRYLFFYHTFPPGSGTAQGANQYRRWLLQGRYNTSTAKMDWSATADLDTYWASGGNPNNFSSSNHFAGFCDEDKVILTRQPTSTSTAIRFYVQTLAAFSAGSSPISGSAGNEVYWDNAIYSTPMCTWNPSTDQVILWGYKSSQYYSYGRIYQRSGTSLNNDSDTSSFRAQIAYSTVTGSQVLKHNSGTGNVDSGDGCHFLLSNWSNNSVKWTTWVMTNENSSTQRQHASGEYQTHYADAHYSNTGWGAVSGASIDFYTTDNTGEGAKGLGQMFRYGGSRPLQLSAGATLYIGGGWGKTNDDTYEWVSKKWVLSYDGTNPSTGQSSMPAFTSGQGTQLNITTTEQKYKFRIDYGQSSTALYHWNPDYQGWVGFQKHYTPAVYKDNDNGQYTANSTKPYFDLNMNVERVKTGNANLETTINFGADPGPYVGLAKTTVTGNGSNTVDINIIGSVDENQSGLLPGTVYYLNHEGTAIAAAPYDSYVDINIGTAVSATKLIVANTSNASGLTVSSYNTALKQDD